MKTTDVDEIVDEYLARLRAALGPLPAARRAQLLDDISQHIVEARARFPEQSPVAVLKLLDRLGTPEEIAREAMEPREPRAARQRRRYGLIVGLSVAVLVVAGGLAAGLLLGLSAGGKATPAASVSTTAVLIVTVPNVVGLPVVEAANELASVGLRVVVQSVQSSALSSAVVAAQAPQAASRVAVGSVVTIQVSAGLFPGP